MYVYVCIFSINLWRLAADFRDFSFVKVSIVLGKIIVIVVCVAGVLGLILECYIGLVRVLLTGMLYSFVIIRVNIVEVTGVLWIGFV